MMTRSPRKIGSRKSTRSIDAVTHVARAWRMAETAAVVSIMARMEPPKTCPRLLASVGIIMRDVSWDDSVAGRQGRG